MDLLGLGISFALGSLASWLLSHYYFRRSVRKLLLVEVKAAFRVFADLGDEPASGLEVKFDGNVVHDLFIIDLDVTNKSDRPIRAPLRPLTFTFPPGSRLIDTFILRTAPENQELICKMSRNSETSPTNAIYEFDLLNPGDGFSCRLLFDGKVDLDKVTADITAEDLPARLKLRRGVGMVTKTPPGKLRIVDWFGVTIVSAVCGIPLFLVGIVFIFNRSSVGYQVFGYRFDVDLLAATGVIPFGLGGALLIFCFVGLLNLLKLLLAALVAQLARVINRIQSSESDV